MESLLIQLLSLPKVAIYAIFGAIGGGVGALVSSLFKGKKKTVSYFISIIFIAIAVQIPNQLLPKLEKELAAAAILKDLKEMRLFSLVFKLHPEAESELKMRMKNIIRTSPQDRIFYDMQAASGEIINRYYQQYLVSASDAVTYKLLQHNVTVMRRFQSQNRPELCVSYYLGTPNFKKDDLTVEFIQKESDLKADVIESAVNSPSPPPKAASAETLIGVIVGIYKHKGYDVNHLKQLGEVATLPADKGCVIGMEFSDALASLDEKQSSYIFKNLVSQGQK